MPEEVPLTTTSYAILGLLAIQPWSTYELAQQMDRSLGRIWPRATSKIYEEPKKLVAAGLARARGAATGARPRTVYSITPKGRRRLAAWLAEPGSGPVLESEQLLKLFFSDRATKADVLATLGAARAWAAERNEGNRAAAEQYAGAAAPFPERAAHLQLVGRFLTEYYRMVAQWAEWAAAEVARWPEDTSRATSDPRTVRETVRRATW
jgi:DNA-binding PadR family transcriptional regulator